MISRLLVERDLVKVYVATCDYLSDLLIERDFVKVRKLVDLLIERDLVMAPSHM